MQPPEQGSCLPWDRDAWCQNGGGSGAGGGAGWLGWVRRCWNFFHVVVKVWTSQGVMRSHSSRGGRAGGGWGGVGGVGCWWGGRGCGVFWQGVAGVGRARGGRGRVRWRVGRGGLLRIVRAVWRGSNWLWGGVVGGVMDFLMGSRR